MVRLRIILVVALTGGSVLGAQVAPKSRASTRPRSAHSSTRATSNKPTSNKDRQFALDVLQAAVALQQSGPQDRLRVLSAAISTVSPLAPALARQWSKEGAQVEAELISAGQKPDVSVLAQGNVDCKTASEFADRVPPASVPAAEQSLIGIASNCGPAAKNAVRSKADAAMQQNIMAPRLLMALMDTLGPKSAWSQQTFTRLFGSLPDPKASATEAPNFAAMYASMAPQVERSVAQDTGLKLLVWLGNVDAGGEHNVAVNIATDAMKKALGDEGYLRALERDVMARQAADAAGQPGEISHPEEESTSVLQAMTEQKNGDQGDALRNLPSASRARQAAALGFSAGTAGDPQTAERYFDMAFSAADETWANRGPGENAPAVVSEVADAAAQVNSVKALARAQKLADPSAQAIAMISVARVVASRSAQ